MADGDTYWCRKCDGAECGPLPEYKCHCGHYAAAHTDIKPHNAKPRTAASRSASHTAKSAGSSSDQFCPLCKKVVYFNEKVPFKDLVYHPKCFRCFNGVCEKQLFFGKVVEVGGQPYCSQRCTELKNQVSTPGALNPRARNGPNCDTCGR